MINIKIYDPNEGKQLAIDPLIEKNWLCLTSSWPIFPVNDVDAIEVNILKFFRYWWVNKIQGVSKEVML